jgi:2-methylcitrate dehydratase PrpD
VPRIEHFTDPSIKRDDFRAVASRITVKEDPAHEAGGLMKGYARVTIRKGARLLADVERIALPGSPSDPPSTDAVRFKIRDCLGAFETATGRPFAAAQTFGAIPEIAPWFGAAPTTVKA